MILPEEVWSGREVHQSGGRHVGEMQDIGEALQGSEESKVEAGVKDQP